MFRRNIGLLALGEVLTRAITFVAFAHLARILTPSLYGLLEVTLAVVMFLGVAGDQGLSVLGTREIAGRDVPVLPLVKHVVSVQLAVTAGLCAVLVVGLLVLPLERGLARLLLGYGLSLLGVPFILDWVFQGRNQMSFVAILQVGRQATFATLAFLLIRSPDRLLWLPAAEVSGIAVAGVLSVALLARTLPTLRIPRHGVQVRSLLRESVPVSGSQIIWTLRMYLPTVLVAALAGGTGAGAFGSALRIVMVFQTILGVYFTAVFPTISKVSFESTDRLANLLHHSIPTVLWPALGLATVTAATAPLAVGLIFGDAYVRQGANVVLAILVWTVPIMALRRHARSAMITLGYQREEMMCSLAGLALLVALVPGLISIHGAIGAALAVVVAEVAGTILIWLCLRRHVPQLHLLRHVFLTPSLAVLSGRQP